MQDSGKNQEEGVDQGRGHCDNQAVGFPAHQGRYNVALYKHPERPFDEERIPQQAAVVKQTYNYRTNKYSLPIKYFMKEPEIWLLFGTIFLIIFLLSGCISEKEQQVPLPDDNPKNITMQELRTFDEGTCKSNGYDWVARPGLCAPDENGNNFCGYTCDISTSDSGKDCYSNDECSGVCLCSFNNKDSDGYIIGKCSGYVYYTEVSDCACILAGKSKDTPVYACT